MVAAFSYFVRCDATGDQKKEGMHGTAAFTKIVEKLKHDNAQGQLKADDTDILHAFRYMATKDMKEECNKLLVAAKEVGRKNVEQAKAAVLKKGPKRQRKECDEATADALAMFQCIH